MATQCTEGKLIFHDLDSRDVVARFDGGEITSDAGAILLREVEKRTGILGRMSECFEDHRDPERIEHTVESLVKQRVMGLCLGYEDLNDHDELCRDRMMALVCDSDDVMGERRHRESDVGKPLAGKSTLNRMELSPEQDKHRRYRKIEADTAGLDALLVDVFLEAHEGDAPIEVVLDVDATDDPLHGEQEGRFFHGYYKSYCYLPLYIFCGHHLLCARLRTADEDAAQGVVEELEGIVARIRARWPGVGIVVRGDSGFCRDELMRWCEEEGVEYVLGLAKNPRLTKMIGEELAEAKRLHEASGEAERVFAELSYRTLDTWSCERRVVAKAEHLSDGENPRFIVTSLAVEQWAGRELYEQGYCARGEMENRIKEQQLNLFADRTSSHQMRANQLRLYFASFAYVLMHALRRLGLVGTALARAQCGTIREKVLKIGAQIRVSVRRVWLSISESYPRAGLFRTVLARLEAIPIRC